MTDRRGWIALGLMVGVAVLIVIYATLDPTQGNWPLHCPMKLLTGLDCAGCGSQRAFHAILSEGDFAGAWHYNPAIFVGVPLMALYGLAEVIRVKHPGLNRVLTSKPVILALAIGIIVWTVARNIF